MNMFTCKHFVEIEVDCTCLRIWFYYHVAEMKVVFYISFIF